MALIRPIPKSGLDVGTAVNSDNATLNITARVGQHFAISSFNGATISGATILASGSQSEPGTVTYYTHLYIVEATSTTISVVTSNINPKVYVALD